MTESEADSSTCLVRRLTEDSREDWDEFVTNCDEATFFHRAGWCDVIERAFNHKTHYLLAKQDGQIRGILPLAEIRSLLFGNSLISVPFCVYGGVAATTEEARHALEEEACKIAETSGVDYLEFRNLESRRTDWKSKDLYVTFRKEISADPEENLKQIPKKQRAMVRKGMRAEMETSTQRSVDRHYAVYSESVRNLGTPVFSKRYFEILTETFKNNCEILTISKSGEDVASVMSFFFRDEVIPYYGGGTAASRKLYGSDFMYWQLMSLAADRGCRVFDFGRSKVGTGSYRFKKHWGFEPQPLSYEYYLVGSNELPNISPANPKYQMFIKIWKYLPLGLTRVVGPRLARYFG